MHADDRENIRVFFREGDRPTHSFAVLSGVTSMYKHSGEGKRQLLIFHFPGDIPDLQSLYLNVLDMGVTAMCKSRIAMIPHEHIRRLYQRFPRIGEGLWRATLVDAAILRERLLNLGQRDAHARIAHLICEFVVRTQLAGIAEEEVCPFPLTQQEIGDALGLSNIHVNRITAELRAEKLADARNGKLTILNWKKLMEAADFDLTYLHLTPHQRAHLRK